MRHQFQSIVSRVSDQFLSFWARPQRFVPDEKLECFGALREATSRWPCRQSSRARTMTFIGEPQPLYSDGEGSYNTEIPGLPAGAYRIRVESAVPQRPVEPGWCGITPKARKSRRNTM